jgi:glycine/D-amino acid oxidase-like deaminating enzyme/nitrite reductase/ring-hydroxylating ferredoxin subunit
MSMKSLWLDRPHITIADQVPFEPRATYDDIVVGAGLTGLTTALLLARAGRRVAVLEARFIGAVTTGNTTAKLTLLQGTRLSRILATASHATAQAYVDGNREGRDWLLRYCVDHDVPVQRRDAYTYAGTPDGREAVRREYEAGLSLGLEVTLESDAGLPFESYAAVRLPDQGQFDPMDVLAALARDFTSRGGHIFEGVRVQGVDARKPARVKTTKGDVFAEHVILATGIPILDRGLYFAKLTPQRSYALAYRVPGAIPTGMYISADTPTRSLRTAPDPAGPGELLLVGGNGHEVGRHPNPQGEVDDLEAWTTSHFPGAERTHAWSAQDYESHNEVPFVGWLPRAHGRAFVATGYSKWGMTNAVAAAVRLSAEILGGNLPWADQLGRRVTRPQSLAEGAIANVKVGAEATRGWVAAELAGLPDRPPAEGEGVVGSDGATPVAVCTVDGVTRTVSAVCAHLGGIVTWNNAERSWDCPLHGSRYAADGTLLEGPATSGLAPLG